MRIPRSTIVMAALTCIPFGLAARDYFAGKDKVDFDADDLDDESDDYDSSKYEAERLAEEAREAARAEERKTAMTAVVDALVGTSDASLGPAFGPIKPGMTDTELGKAEETTAVLRKLARTHELTIAFDDSDGILQTIEISPSDRADDQELLCTVLRDKFAAKWSNVASTQSATVWLDPAAGLRAEFTDTYGCSLTFRRFAPVEKWIAKKGGVVPAWAIGQTNAKLVQSLEGQRLDLSEAEYAITWAAPGLGAGTKPTTIMASIVKSKVAAVTAKVYISSATREELTKQLDALYGTSREDDDGVVHWDRKPPVTLAEDYDGDAVVVTVGTVPEE